MLSRRTEDVPATSAMLATMWTAGANAQVAAAVPMAHWSFVLALRRRPSGGNAVPRRSHAASRVRVAEHVFCI